MSAQKRSYDNDSSHVLGSYDADINNSFSSSSGRAIVASAVSTTTTSNQNEWATKKRLRLEQEQQSLEQPSSEHTTHSDREWMNQLNSLVNSDSENYEDIDYGEDEDEDEGRKYNCLLDAHFERSSQSVDSSLLNANTVGKNERVAEQVEENQVSNSAQECEQIAGGVYEEELSVHEEAKNTPQKYSHEKTLKQRLGPPVDHQQQQQQPRKPCKMFPNCRFGKDCLYSHPLCKFSSNCSRPNCAFFHKTIPPGHLESAATSDNQETDLPQPPAPRPIPKTRYHPPTLKCKYGANCVNQMCKFYHPSYQRSLPLSHHHHQQRSDPCRFGANCLLDTCPFTHPTDAETKKPASAFKWTAQS